MQPQQRDHHDRIGQENSAQHAAGHFGVHRIGKCAQTAAHQPEYGHQGEDRQDNSEIGDKHHHEHRQTKGQARQKRPANIARRAVARQAQTPDHQTGAVEYDHGEQREEEQLPQKSEDDSRV